MKKNIRKRAKTPIGEGCIIGIDMEYSHVPRYIVELDNGVKFGNSDPCFFPDKIEILKENK